MQIYNVGSHSVNCYLIDSGSHRLLMDCGFPGTLNDLGREMRKTGYIIRDIHYLMVTHFHIDHAGAVQELKEQGVKFVLFDIQVAHINSMESMAAGKWKYSMLNRNDNLLMRVDESTAFLHKLGLEGQVVATPGHSDDSITLLLSGGEAFTGDLRAENLVTDKDSLEYHSWQMLRKAGAQTIYPGHGNVYKI